MDSSDLDDVAGAKPPSGIPPAQLKETARISSTPIHGLPAELILHIFDMYIGHCYEKDNNFYASTEGFLGNDKLIGPWAISQICSPWRQLALSIPHFWSNIRFIRFLAPGPVVYTSLELIKLQIERSGNSPLSLYLDCPHNASGCRQLADLVRPHHRRWGTLELDTHCTEFNDALSKDRPLLCPILERLSMHIFGGSIQDFGIFADHGCPRLRSATFFESVTLPFESGPNNVFPGTLVEELELLGVYYLDDFIDIYYERLRGLVVLKVDDCFPPLRDTPLLNTHLLPTLKVIEAKTPTILDWLIAPALTTVKTGTLDDPLRNSAFQEITSLIHRSKCSIKSFDCAVHIEASEALLQLLEAMPMLHELWLRFDGVMEWPPITEALQRIEGASFECLPKLRQLYIEWITYGPGPRLDLSPLLDVLERRWNVARQLTGSQRTLETVQVVCRYADPWDIVDSEATQARLDMLRDAGMVLTLRLTDRSTDDVYL